MWSAIQQPLGPVTGLKVDVDEAEMWISGYLICIYPNGVVHSMKDYFLLQRPPSSGFQVLLETRSDLPTGCGAWAQFQKISIATWRVLLMEEILHQLRLVLYPVIYKVL